MKIDIPLTPSGYLPDRYSKHAASTELYQGYPLVSPPLTITDIPAGTVSLALTFLDFDAVPVGGFVWIHWLAANIAPQEVVQIPENASQLTSTDFVQGRNSNAGKLVNITDAKISQHYVGPQPPDQDHDYQLCVYALNRRLDLNNGYWYNDFHRQLENSVIASTTIHVPGRV